MAINMGVLSINLKNLIDVLCPELAEWRRFGVGSGLRVAVVGFGKMGLLHGGILNLLIPGIVKAVVDKSFLLTFGASRVVKSIRFYRDLDAMLREVEPDVVYVATPTSSHYPIVKKPLEHGTRFIFVEKPPTVNYQQLQDLLSVKKSDQVVMVGFQKRYALTFRHAKLLLDTGVVGEVQEVYAYVRSGDILESTTRFDALGRGVLLDLGVHLLNLLTWFFKVESIESAESRSMYTRVDDFFKAVLRAKGGARIIIEATWSDPEYRIPETFIEIRGSKGVIRVAEDYLKVSTLEEHELLGNKKELALYKPHYYQGIPPVNLADPEYTIENMHFLISIHREVQPLTSIENSAETMKLIDELYKAARKV
uniref:Gfo/Idh/MocA family oxidoreductase n=1 Tax=Ignisphaera aggregans TaxID=334771 RepID=A0A7J2U2J7_9CREN